MKTYLSSFLSLIVLILNAQTKELTVNAAESANTLVVQHLLGFGCADVSNFEISPSSNDNIRSFSYNGDTNKFPFRNGIIISTGRATSIPLFTNQRASSTRIGDNSGYNANQNLTNTAVNNKILKLKPLVNPSFSDLEFITQIRNTAFLSFDFTPIVETFSFRFFFASEEYESFACLENYSDVFAFFVQNVDTGEIVNLAQIKDSQSGNLIPIKVSNIRPNIDNNSGLNCEQRNGDKYVANENNNVIEFYGRTAVLTASGSGLTIGQRYNINLIITDRSDFEYDSAVFIEGGSFKITSEIGEDRTIENGNPVLSGETITINPKSITGANYTWFKNGVLMAGVTDNQIDVRDTGVYKVNINLTLSGGTSCNLDLERKLDFVAAPNLSTSSGTLIQCDPLSGVSIAYNLNEIESIVNVIDTDRYPPYTYTYYATEEHARNKTNGFSDSTYYPSGDSDIIYVRVENRFSFYSIASINLQSRNLTIENPFTDRDSNLIYSDDNSKIILKSCDNATTSVGDRIATFDLSSIIPYLKSRITSVPEENIKITFYEDIVNAIFETNSISGNSYRNNLNLTNANGEQSLVVRFEDSRVNSCLSFLRDRVILQTITVPTNTTNISPLYKCGSSSQSFDLTEKQSEILNSISGTGYTVTYFYRDGSNNIRIDNPTSYQSDFQNGTVDRITIYYSVTYSDDINCSSPLNSFEIVLDNPKVPSTPLKIDSCFPTFETTYNLTTLESQILSGQSGITLTFYDEDDNVITNPSDFKGVVGENRLMKKEYTVSVRLQNSRGCTSNTNITLVANFTPELQTPSAIEECEQDNDRIDEFNLRIRESQILGNLEANSFTFKYFESMQNAQNETNQIQNPEKYISKVAPYEVFVKVTPTNNSCSVIFPITLNVSQVSRTRFQEEYSLCLKNDDTFFRDPPVLRTGLNANDYTFEWYLASTTSGNPLVPIGTGEFYTPLRAGTISMKATNKISGCRIWDTTTVKVYYATENFSVKSLGDLFSESNDIEIVTQDKGTYLFSIDGMNFQESAIFRGLSPGTYKAYIRYIGNCREDLIIDFIVLDYPKFFTPNGDGINDVWQINNLNEVLHTPEYKIQIFNREGQLVIELNEQKPSWDGMINNISLPIGDYWFKLFYTTNEGMKTFQSHFTLTR